MDTPRGGCRDVRRLAVLAIAAEAVFLATVLISDLRDDQAMARSISDGVHGADGTLLSAGFAAHAVSLGALAAMSKGKVQGGLMAAALGMVLVTAFPTEIGGRGMTGRLHTAGAYLAFGGVAWSALAGPRKGIMGPFHAAVPVTTLAMAAALMADAEAWKVLERMQAFVNGAWITLMATRAR